MRLLDRGVVLHLFGRTLLLNPLHTHVTGRARFKIEGLYRSDPLKRFLEVRLSHRREIKHASASVLTGNLLVCYNSNHTPESIHALVHSLVLEWSETPVVEEGASADESLLSGRAPQRGKEASLREKLRRLLATTEEQEEHPWHLVAGDAALERLGTTKEAGLPTPATVERLRRFGPNVLPEPTSRSRWEIFFQQFKSLPVALLGAAAGISAFTGGVLEAVVIAGVVVANAAIGYVTESQAEKTIRSLKSYIRPMVGVIRDGRLHEIPAEDLVVGDILFFKPGSYVPADARLLQASHLHVDESVLTGESMPALKSTAPLKGKHVPLTGRTNMVYRGTLVTGGEGLAVTVATGRFTEIGRLQAMLEETVSPETPSERQLRQMGDQLVLICGAICGVVFLMGFLRGHGLLQMVRTSVSLAAAAVPEGLPAAATINFALGVREMRRNHVLVRHLQAVETLGAVETVCLDKTGTLTMNRMTVTRIHIDGKAVEVRSGRFFLNGMPIDPMNVHNLRELLKACALCNESEIRWQEDGESYVLHGSPTENALLDVAIRSGFDVRGLGRDYTLLSVNHRSESRLFMSTLYAAPSGDKLFALKGSPLEVLAQCKWSLNGGEKILLSEEARREVQAENERMAGEALRVLVVAVASLNGKEVETGNDLTWLGLVGMADPIREGVEELIGVFHRAGIETVMITGDQSPTAYSVAKRLDIADGKSFDILDSSELSSVEPEVMEALAKRVKVYARVSPAHKLRIVQALQAAHKVVAMTGDGINDGPALKAADIGIAMGKSGTDVARQVADIVLEEDNLETLVIALRDGRTTYSNIRKSVRFFISTNFSEIMVTFAAMAAGIGFPLSVMQLLWINLISDIFPGLALSMEAPEPDMLNRPPRKAGEPLLSKNDFRRMTMESAIISGSALGAYGFGLLRYGQGPRAGSIAFQSLTIAQLLHAVTCRSERHSLFDGRKPPPNPYLNLAVGGSIVLQLATLFVPGLRGLLGMSPLSPLDLAVIGGTSLLSFTANETMKKAQR